MSVSEKLATKSPKKLLALDGGGIRGMMTVEVLGEIERLLKKELGKGDEFVLADYFDYIAGTSTGAIIATCLSLGWKMDKIRHFYENSGAQMFDKAGLIERFGYYKYEDEKLADLLKREFGECTTLGSEDLQTLLMLVLRNSTTDSPWPVSNNPKAKYNDRTRADCNLDLPLWKLVRASTAAPTYFPPENVQIGKQEFIFVDGGVTPYNNPAFQLFMMATVEPYNLNWETGEEELLLISVGTGTSPAADGQLDPVAMHKLFQAKAVPAALMFSALNEQDLLCRVFGKCLAGDTIDRELGDLIEKKGPVSPKLFTYVRYDAELTRTGLDGLGLHDIQPENVQEMDSVQYVSELQRVGKAVGQKKVKRNHFAGFLAC